MASLDNDAAIRFSNLLVDIVVRHRNGERLVMMMMVSRGDDLIGRKK